MSLKRDMAERVVVAEIAVQRNPDLEPLDRVARRQDIVERALGEYGRLVATARGAIEQGYKDDQHLLDWICANWLERASRVHAELLLDPESGPKAAMRRAMAAEQEAAA
jgi:hypothetical protein